MTNLDDLKKLQDLAWASWHTHQTRPIVQLNFVSLPEAILLAVASFATGIFLCCIIKEIQLWRKK
jgi:hypothetical protein